MTIPNIKRYARLVKIDDAAGKPSLNKVVLVGILANHPEFKVHFKRYCPIDQPACL